MYSAKKMYLLKKLDHVLQQKHEIDDYAEEFFSLYMQSICAAALLVPGSAERREKEKESAELWDIYNDFANKSTLLQLKHLRITRRFLRLK